MKVLWEERAWADYLYWQMQDRKTLKRINELVKDMQRDAFHGIGSQNLCTALCQAIGVVALMTRIVLFMM